MSTTSAGKESGISADADLRVITAAMAVVGILAACQMAESDSTFAMFGIFGTIAGSYVSYRRRQANNFWLKWAIAAGILVVLGFFIEELAYRVQATIADARAPLTNMLVALQALHSFDQPARRDLNVSALVGLTLMASAATLSRDLLYGIYLLAFVCFGSYMLYLDCISRTTAGARRQRIENPAHRNTPRTRLTVASAAGLTPLIGLALFLTIPKPEFRMLSNVRVSLKLNIPFLTSNKISNPMLLSARRADGALTVNPQAYHGFNQELDLNYRGRLSDAVVLKVAAPEGEFWRAMAFDTYNGHQWTMSKPKKTYDRLTTSGAAILLSPLPSLVTPGQVQVEELSQVFYLEQDEPNLIPAAAVPDLIYFPTNKVLVDTYGSLRSPVLMEKDMVYTVFSLVPRYKLSALAEQKPLPEQIRRQVQERFSQYLQLPDNLPYAVRQFGWEVAGRSGNWFNQANRINLFLQRRFRYNLEVPPTAAGQDCVADFLFRSRAGYCEHFSTSFVVLCRCCGIPARLITGFTPGEYNPFTGLWDVRMRDAHAWAEVYIPGWGWVPFDPTPDGAPPGLTRQGQHADWAFLDNRLQELYKWFSHLRPVQKPIKWLFSAARQIWQAISSGLTLFALLWQGALLAMVLIAAGAITRQIACRPGKAQPADAGPRLDATRQYLRVCRALARLNIERQPSETGEALLNRVQKRLAADIHLKQELPGLLEKFIEKYSHARFSIDGKAEEMAAMADTIAREIDSAGISSVTG